MTALSQGTTLFSASVKSAIEHGSDALRSSWIFVLIHAAVYVFAVAFGEGLLGSLAGIVSAFTTIFLIAILAVYIHRMVLLAPDAAKLSKEQRIEVVKIYAWHWFVASVVLGLIVLGVFAVCVSVFANSMETFKFSNLWFLIPLFVMLTVIMFLFYRISTGLPQIACGFDRMTFRESWRATRPFSGVILVMCLIASVLIAAAEALIVLVGIEDYSVVRGLCDVVISVVSALVGAAMFNQLYQKVMAD